MKIPYHELFKGTGIVKKTQLSSVPPGRLGVDAGKLVFKNDIENIVENRKTIILADEKFSLYRHIEEDDDNSILFTVNYILFTLLQNNFNVYLYCNYALVKLDVTLISSEFFNTNFLVQTNGIHVRSEFYALCAAEKIPADMVYVLDVPKVFQIMLDEDLPCVTEKFVELYNHHYATHLERSYNYPLAISTETIPYSIDYDTQYLGVSINIEDLKAYLETRSLRDITCLKIDCCIYGENQNLSNWVDIFIEVLKLPNLTSLRFTSVILDHDKISISHISNSIKYIVLEDIQDNYNTDKITSFLRGVAPNLRICSINDELCILDNPGENANSFVLDKISCVENLDVTIIYFQTHNTIFIEDLDVEVDMLFDFIDSLEDAEASRVKYLNLANIHDLKFIDMSRILKIFKNLQTLQIPYHCLSVLDLKAREQIESIEKIGIKCIVLKTTDHHEGYTVNNLEEKQLKTNSFKFNDPQKDVTYNIEKIFFAASPDKDPQASKIRKSIYQKYLSPATVRQDFNPKDGFELTEVKKSFVKIKQIISPCEVRLELNFRQKLAANEIFGTFFLKLGASWSDLPSVATNETLVKISAIDVNNAEVPISIGYCGNTSKYGIKLLQGDIPIEVQINMVIQTNKYPHNFGLSSKQKRSIIPLIDKYKGYKLENMHLYDDLDDISSQLDFLTDGLSLPQELLVTSVDDYLDSLDRKQAGACQERAILFSRKVLQIEFPPQDVRIVRNAIHMFCEVKYNDMWSRVDLGGSPATVNIYNQEQFLSPQQKYFDSNSLTVSKKLLHIPGKEIEGYALGLINKYHNQELHVFYINSYLDLNLHNQDSEFNSFLRNVTESATLCVLIINWNNFTPEEKVKVNFLLDNPPSNTAIIGMEDPYSPTYDNDAAFISRFDEVLLKDPNVPDCCWQMPREDFKQDYGDETIVIECYDSANWQDYVFGQYHVNEKGVYFKESELLQRLNVKNSNSKRKKLSPITIIFKNPPLDQNDFRIFWTKAFITGKFYVPMNDKEYYGFNHMSWTKNYDWSASANIISWCNKFEDESEVVHILNSGSIELFFKNYFFTHGKQLGMKPGVVESNTGSVINVQLTHNIEKEKWSRLLDECVKCSVRLNIMPCQDLQLPLGFYQPEFADVNFVNSDTCFVVSNPASYVKDLLNKKPEILTFDVSETIVAELLSDVIVTKHDNLDIYMHVDSDIVTALKEGKLVVFYGELSQRFAETFASMLALKFPYLHVNGEKIAFAGKVIVVIDEKSAKYFQFLSQVKVTESYESVSATEEIVNVNPANENEQRLALILNKLKSHPMAYISGPTGIGKTTFVLDYMRNRLNYAIFNGMDQILSWQAMSSQDKYVILFIDEANMTGSDFSIFNSLFLSDKILYKGKILQVSAKHKIIYAGNPAIYGGDRKAPKLLLQYPDIEVKFLPLSDNALEEICRPFSGLFFSSAARVDQTDGVKRFIEIYRSLINLDDNHVYLTLRELKIALTFCSQNYDLNTMLYLICKDILPEITLSKFKSALISSTTVEGLINTALQAKKIKTDTADHLVTASRYPALLLINALLDSRNSALAGKIPGLDIAGMILEGPAGTGKSELIRFALRSKGIKEIAADMHTIETLESGKDHFCCIRANMQLDLLQRLLIAAYKKNIIIIIDEFNTCLKGLELLLNQLLMHNYEEGGVQFNNHGFLLFGTQNPISKLGRNLTSNALQRRLIYTKTTDYDNKEMLSILSHKYTKVPKETIEASVNKFISNRYTYMGSGIKNSEPRSFRELDREIYQLTQDLKPSRLSLS